VNFGVSLAKRPSRIVSSGLRLDGVPEHATTETWQSTLRARGYRLTPQRELVLRAVERLDHATPDEVLAAVREESESVNVSTVYRTLELLEEIGLVWHTHLGHGAPTFRPADDEHVHIVCHVCGRVIDAPHSLADDLAERLFDEQGFLVDRSHFTVFGRCHDCVTEEQTTGEKR
jgi:Fur family transcriptional regulator, ferric uptake regulator